MLFFKVKDKLINVCFDMQEGSIVLEAIETGRNPERVSKYSLFTFEENQVTIEELDKNQNELIKKYLTVYNLKMAEAKQFYQIPYQDVIGYSDGANNFYNIGFNAALNKVFNVFSAQARKDAYEFLKNCTDYDDAK